MEGLTLLEFVQSYRKPKSVGLDPVSRKKEVVVIVICSPDPQGPKYERYCRQKLMLHQPYRHLDELLGGLETHSQAYSAFLQSSTVPPSLADDIHRLEAAQRVDREENEVNSLLSLPVKGDFKPLEGKRLQTIQQMLAAVDYIIIDEMSIVGRKMFGQVDDDCGKCSPRDPKSSLVDGPVC